MKNIKNIILNVTGLNIDVLTYEYDDTTNLYYIFGSYASQLCHIELSKDGKHIVIYTDNMFILHQIAYILDNKRNRKSFMYANDLYNLNKITQCTSFKYGLKCVSDEEFQREYEKERIKKAR